MPHCVMLKSNEAYTAHTMRCPGCEYMAAFWEYIEEVVVRGWSACTTLPMTGYPGRPDKPNDEVGLVSMG